jgi:hypothetical protein
MTKEGFNQFYEIIVQLKWESSAWERFGVVIIQSIIDDNEQCKPYLINSKIGKTIGF